MSSTCAGLFAFKESNGGLLPEVILWAFFGSLVVIPIGLLVLLAGIIKAAIDGVRNARNARDGRER